MGEYRQQRFESMGAIKMQYIIIIIIIKEVLHLLPQN